MKPKFKVGQIVRKTNTPWLYEIYSIDEPWPSLGFHYTYWFFDGGCSQESDLQALSPLQEILLGVAE